MKFQAEHWHTYQVTPSLLKQKLFDNHEQRREFFLDFQKSKIINFDLNGYMICELKNDMKFLPENRHT